MAPTTRRDQPATGAALRLSRRPEDVEAAGRLAVAATSSRTLDRLTQLAARLLATPAAQVSLLADAHVVACRFGLVGKAPDGHAPVVEALCAVTAGQDAPVVVDDALEDPRVSGLPAVAVGGVRAYLGVPLRTRAGHGVGALCVYDPAARSWSAGDVEVLEHLAAAALAELERGALADAYEADRALSRLAVEAGRIGTWHWDLDTGEITLDDRLRELFGDTPDTPVRTIEDFTARLHPDDRGRVQLALKAAIESGGEYEAEYRIVRPDGLTRWVHARGHALSAASGAALRVLGAAHDTTALREGEARLSRILESMSAGFVQLDPQWRFTYVNAEGERILGVERHALLGGILWELFPAALGSDFERHYRHAAATGEQVSFDAYYPPPLDAWYEVRAWYGSDGLSVCFLDVTARRRAQEEAERAARRAALLAEVATALAGTLEAEEAVGRLARVVVPELAEWSIVSLVGDAGPRHSIRDIGWWHADPQIRPVVGRYAPLRLPSMSARAPALRSLETGQQVVLRHGAADAIAGALMSAEARDLLRRLDPVSAVFLPLRAAGRTLGLLSLFSRDPHRHTSEAAVDTAIDVAARAGLALENARLYDQQRRMAEGLQRSLLTDPPPSGRLQVAVRYEPAAEVAQVGGDWYDVFRLADGATVVTVGDVVGHDTAAAAAMSQVRGLLRGIAATTGAPPHEVLTRLDAAMEVLDVGTAATAVVARLDPVPGRQALRLRWSNAGHPPPLTVCARGAVRVLGETDDADLLLGFDARVTRTDAEALLEPGTTLLLYTDGLVERRGTSLEDGLLALQEVLGELADCPLDDLCDELLARMLPGRAEDDVALAAVRLRPHA